MLANSGQLWFYHAPSKRVQEEKKDYPVASQVPGLAALDPLDQEAWEREVGVKSQKRAKETDSNYIRLAKQGGRKNLLAFTAPSVISEKPQPYPRADWFDHHDNDLEKDEKILSQTVWQPPEYMVHGEYETSSDNTMSNLTEKPKKKRTPFYTDNMSVWARQEEEKASNLNGVKKRRRNKNKSVVLPQIHSRPPKSPPVSFSRLIGGDYGNEWYRKQLTQRRSGTKYIASDKGYLNMTEYQQTICGKTVTPKKLKPIVLTQGKKQMERSSEKPIFKLSKFNKVESKLFV